MKEQNPDNNLHFESVNEYYNFFENAPVALYIEDFSKVKAYVEAKANESNLDIETYLIQNPRITDHIHYLVEIKDVNITAVKLYKAASKKDLLENLEKVFTNHSSKGFSKLVFDVLTGKKETAVETVNKNLEGEVINVKIKYNVQKGSEKTLNSIIVSIEDITESVKTSTALALSEKRYKESQEIAKMASWFYDFNSRQLFWSDEVYNMVDLQPHEHQINLEFYLSFVHPEDQKTVSDFTFKNLLANPSQSFNYRIKTKKGETKHLFEKRSVIIKNGRIQRIVGICQDITERVLSGQSLNVTKQLLSNTLSSIQDGFVILDKNSNYLYANQVAADLLGKTIEDLIGKNIWQEFPERRGDLFFDNYHIALKTKKPISFENYFAPWDRWFENRIIPSNNNMLIFFHETTQKKESENKIKAAYNIINKSSSVAILCENEWDFPVVFASENSKNLFGYTSDELLNGDVKIYNLVHPEDLDAIRTHFFKRLKSKKETDVKPNAFRIISKKGDIKWIETSVDIIKNSENKITHIQGIAEDITKRKNAEDLLFKSNQRLQDQFNNTPLASIIWDLDFKVIDWNNSAHRIFGYSFNEAKGKHAKDLIVAPNEVDLVNNVWANLLAQKAGYRSKNENITKSGNKIICDWYNVTLKDTDGKVIGVASLVDDITERILSKGLLEKSEKKYRDIFEKSIDAILILNNGLFADCNLSTLKMFGYESKEALISLHPSQISPEFQPDGESSYAKAEEMMKITMDEGSNRFRWYHKQKNGHVFPAEVSLTKIEDEDKSTIHVVIRDISDRVKNEQIEEILYNISKAALTIDNFNEFGYFIRDELNKIIDTSNFYIALYNEEKNSFFTPVMVDEMDDITEFSAEKTLTGLVLKTKKSLLFTNESHPNLKKNDQIELIGVDSKIWLGVPLKTQNKVFGVIVVQSYTNKKAYNKNDVQLLEFVADQISGAIERKNSDYDLKNALKKAQESDRLKSAFLANMSHEIRTPMNGIIGFSELFLEKDLSYNERKEYAKIVIDSSKQLLTIVNDILDISKIEAGVVQLNYESVIINELLSNLEAFYAPLAKEKNLELICKKGLSEVDSAIKIDKTKLHQVLTNLLSNAFKFTDNGSVEFGYEKVENNLQFYVKDTGPGIDKKLHNKIFDRFIQANVNYDKQNKGTGLGLAISKKFIELFGGDIWLNSNNTGTTVYFTIPYDNLNIQLPILEVQQKPKIKQYNKKITILVAEDEIYNLMYINELFAKTTYEIIEANNGKEAVEKVQKNPNIDLVLMDIKMPIMNGKDAMKEIKIINPNIPVIALSAFAMESDKEVALSTGFDFYLSKPIDRKLLFELIDEITKE
jgi:PAS domain S-box-containing protein